MITIADEIAAKLKRLSSLHGLIQNTDDYDDRTINEFLGLRAELAKHFTPLLDQLANAGLLMLSVDDPECEYQSEGLASHAYEHGAIWIEGSVSWLESERTAIG